MNHSKKQTSSIFWNLYFGTENVLSFIYPWITHHHNCLQLFLTDFLTCCPLAGRAEVLRTKITMTKWWKYETIDLCKFVFTLFLLVSFSLIISLTNFHTIFWRIFWRIFWGIFWRIFLQALGPEYLPSILLLFISHFTFHTPWNHCAPESSPTIARVISSALHSRDWGAFSDWFPLCFLHREIDFCYVHNPNYYLSINPYYIKLYYRRESQSDEIFWEKGFLTFFFRFNWQLYFA